MEREREGERERDWVMVSEADVKKERGKERGTWADGYDTMGSQKII